MAALRKMRFVLAVPLGAVALIGGQAAADRAETSPATVPIIPAAPLPPDRAADDIAPGMRVLSRDGQRLGVVERVIGDEGGRHTVIIELALSLGITGDTVSVTAAEVEPDGGQLTLDMTRDQFVEMAELQG